MIGRRTVRLPHNDHTKVTANRVHQMLHQNAAGAVQRHVQRLHRRRTGLGQQEIAQRDVRAAMATDHEIYIDARLGHE